MCIAQPTSDQVQIVADALTKLASTPRQRTLYDVLKDFQPLIAALVALIAASLAYRGANAKVNFDREIAKRQHTKERLGLYIRLISQLKKLAFDADIFVVITDGGRRARSEFRFAGIDRLLRSALRAIAKEVVNSLDQLHSEEPRSVRMFALVR
jgi:hypothetical protein